MKLVGLSGGRPMGNSEVLLKEAMMGAEEVVSGLEVEVIRLQYLTIKPCIGCWVCADPKRQNKEWRCINHKKDHMAYLAEKLSDANGVILSCPAYAMTVPGMIFNLRDRLAGARRNFENKQKVGGYIVVGGSDWVNLCLPLMPTMFTDVMKTVDRMVLPFTAALGQAVLNIEAMKRAKKLGRNIGKAMLMPYEKVKYLGEGMKVSDAEVKFLCEAMELPIDWIKGVVREEDHCPICHSNLLHIYGNQVQCAICDIKGTIKLEGNKLLVNYSEEELQKARLGHLEKVRHAHIVDHSSKIYAQKKDEIIEKLKKYMTYGNITAPPTLAGEKPVKLTVNMVDRQQNFHKAV